MYGTLSKGKQSLLRLDYSFWVGASNHVNSSNCFLVMTAAGLLFSSSILKHNVQNVKFDCSMNNSKWSVPELPFVVQGWVTIQTSALSSSPEYVWKWAKIWGLLLFFFFFPSLTKKERYWAQSGWIFLQRKAFNHWQHKAVHANFYINNPTAWCSCFLPQIHSYEKFPGSVSVWPFSQPKVCSCRSRLSNWKMHLLKKETISNKSNSIWVDWPSQFLLCITAQVPTVLFYIYFFPNRLKASFLLLSYSNAIQ